MALWQKYPVFICICFVLILATSLIEDKSNRIYSSNIGRICKIITDLEIVATIVQPMITIDCGV